MDGYKTFAAIEKKHKGLTASILKRAIKQGFFPGARRKGMFQHYLPDDEIKAFIAFRKLPRSEQIRIHHKDPHLMLTGDVTALLGVDISYFNKYTELGYLPKHRFVSLYGVKVYHIDDVMACAEKKRMLYDAAVAKKFGWPHEEKSEKKAENAKAEFKPMLQK